MSYDKIKCTKSGLIDSEIYAFFCLRVYKHADEFKLLLVVFKIYHVVT